MLLLFLFIGLVMPVDSVIMDFNSESSLSNWLTIDDGVMGGRSSSSDA